MELAESIEHDRAKVWTIKLRKGVKFHDGKTLTADDVVYSLTATRTRRSARRPSRSPTDRGDQGDRPAGGDDPPDAPNADLPVILGTYHFKIVKDGTTDFTTGIGTGPFKCKEFKPGVRSIAARNENFWKGVGP